MVQRGYRSKEIDILMKKGFSVVSLGSTIFGVEIAAVVAISQLMYAFTKN